MAFGKAEELKLNIMGDASNLSDALDKSNSRIAGFSEKIGKIGKIATAGGVIVTAAFAKIVTSTAEAGDKFDKMSLRTGIAVEDLSALAYAADISGTSIETMEKGLKGLTKVMDDASMGIGEGMEAFELLDIAVVDTEGNLRPTIDVLKEAAAKISAIENPTKQAALAMDLFGARAGPELLPLLKAGEGGIEDLMKKAEELGITMSTEAATAAAEFTDRMTDLKGSLAGAGRDIGEVLIPAITPLIEKVVEIIGKIKAWAEENEPLVETIIKVGAKIGILAAVGGPILMAVAAFGKIVLAIKAIGSVAAIASPIGILIVAIGAVYLAWKNWDEIVKYVKDFKDKIIKFLGDLKDIAIKKVKDMIDKVIKTFSGIAELPKKALKWGKDIITDFVSGIVGLIDRLLGGAISKITGAFDKVKGLIDKVKGWGKSIVESLGNGMSEGNPRIAKAMDDVVETVAKPIRGRSPIQFGELRNLNKWGKNISEELAGGIIGGIPAVETAGDELAVSFKDKMMMLHTDVVIETKDMMDDVEIAIKDGAPKIETAAGGLATDFMDVFETLKTDFKTNFIDPVINYIVDGLTPAIENILFGVEDFEMDWEDFWSGLWSTLKKYIANMITKLLIAIPLMLVWNFLTGGIASWASLLDIWGFLGFKKGGGIGYNLGGEIKGFDTGGGIDTVPIMATPGEYMIAKPMVDFIKQFKMIPSNLISAIAGGFPTPAPAFASGGSIGDVSDYGTQNFGTKIYVDIHDNRISDDVDVRKLAATVSGEILKRINLNRRH